MVPVGVDVGDQRGEGRLSSVAQKAAPVLTVALARRDWRGAAVHWSLLHPAARDGAARPTRAPGVHGHVGPAPRPDPPRSGGALTQFLRCPGAGPLPPPPDVRPATRTRNVYWTGCQPCPARLADRQPRPQGPEPPDPQTLGSSLLRTQNQTVGAAVARPSADGASRLSASRPAVAERRRAGRTAARPSWLPTGRRGSRWLMSSRPDQAGPES